MGSSRNRTDSNTQKSAKDVDKATQGNTVAKHVQKSEFHYMGNSHWPHLKNGVKKIYWNLPKLYLSGIFAAYSRQKAIMWLHLPPVFFVLRFLLLLVYPMFSFSQKFIFFRNRRVIPICFWPGPGRPFREILVWLCSFHSRDITPDSARGLIVCCAVYECLGLVYFRIISFTEYVICLPKPSNRLRRYVGQFWGIIPLAASVLLVQQRKKYLKVIVTLLNIAALSKETIPRIFRNGQRKKYSARQWGRRSGISDCPDICRG